MKARNDIITLLSYSSSRTNGIRSNITDTRKQVFAEIKSVMFKEYFETLRNGTKADIVFKIDRLDYGNQMNVEFDERIYKVIRTYVIDEYTIELTCSEVK